MAVSLANPYIDSLRDSRQYSLGQAIRRKMGRRGFAWISERLLFKTLCHSSWSLGQVLVAELTAAGEFYRIAAAGRGPDGAVAHTLYFVGWADRRRLEEELRVHNMPLEAFLQLDRCLEDHRRRVSFFTSRNDAGGHQQESPTGLSRRKRTDAIASGRPFRATHDPPRAVETSTARRQSTPSDGRLSEPASGSAPEPVADVPEDLRYLYPQRFPDASAPKRRRMRGLELERLRDLLPFADQDIR